MNTDDHYPNSYRDYDPNDTYFLNFNDSAIINDYGVTTTFLRGTGCLLLRAGLVLIQFGCVPSTNTNGVILQNILDLSCATVAYGTFGFMFSFGKDKGGVVGWGSWIVLGVTDLDNVVLGWSSVVVLTGIYTTMFSGRLHYVGCIFITTIYAGFIIPMIMHWPWSSSGWMYKATFIHNLVTYKDHGGGMIIHTCGGVVALVGTLFLGRRLIRLQDLDEASLPPNSHSSATIGYILVIIGLMGVCLPTANYELTHEPLNYIGLTFFNNLLAAAGGIIITVVLQFIFSRGLFLHHWSLMRYMQGAIAGIVTIASGVDVYTPYVSLGLGVFGAVLYFIIAYYMLYSALEDYANVIAIHLICGFLSTLLPPLCAKREGFGVPHKIIIHFSWQIIAGLAILSVMFSVAVVTFFILSIFNILRNQEEEQNHRRVMIAVDKGPRRNCYRRLWKVTHDSQVLQPGYRANKESFPQNVNVFSIEDMKARPVEEDSEIHQSSHEDDALQTDEPSTKHVKF